MKSYIFLIFFFALTSCSSMQKATQKVLTDEVAFNKVGAKWASINPCVNDTSFEVIKGEVVTISDTVSKYIIDDIKVKELSDSLMKLNVSSSLLVSMSYESGYKDAINNQKPIIKMRVDTIKNFIVDNRALNIVKDTLSQYKQLLAKSEGVNQQLKEDAKKSTKHKLIMGLIILILGGVSGMLLKSKFL
jgi:hypothetical protein